MKRALSIILLLSIGLSFSAFQCSSTELTSAKLYIQQNNFEKAIESLQKDVDKNPQSDEGYYLLGYVQGEMGDITSMLENFDKSAAISDKFEKNIIGFSNNDFTTLRQILEISRSRLRTPDSRV